MERWEIEGLTPGKTYGVSVVNIDNGYGAGYIANQINQAVSGKRDKE